MNEINTSSSQKVMDLIIKDVRMGNFPDGKISSLLLSKKYKEGITIVREALHQLVGRGFVYSIPNKGYIVPNDILRVQLDSIECYIKLINPFAKEMIKSFTYHWAGELSSKLSIMKMLILEYDSIDHQKKKDRAIEILSLLMELYIEFLNILKTNFSPSLGLLYEILSERMAFFPDEIDFHYKIYSNGFPWLHGHIKHLEEIVATILKKDSPALIQALNDERKNYMSILLNYDQKKNSL